MAADKADFGDGRFKAPLETFQNYLWKHLAAL